MLSAGLWKIHMHIIITSTTDTRCVKYWLCLSLCVFVSSLCGAGVGSHVPPTVCLSDWCVPQSEGGLFYLWRRAYQASQGKSNTYTFFKTKPTFAVVFYYLKRAYYLLGCTFRYIFCIFVSRSGIHRGSGSQAEKLCRWRCLYSPVPQKVSFCLMCLKMDIRISTNKKAGVEYNTCILYPFVPYLIQRIVLPCIK